VADERPAPRAELLGAADTSGSFAEPGFAAFGKLGRARLCQQLVTKGGVLEMRRGVGAQHDDLFEREALVGGAGNREVNGATLELGELFHDGGGLRRLAG
jgi:hypothetical protein